MIDDFQAARLLAAFNVFARHNHKAGDPSSPEPSPEYLIRRIQRACCVILNASIFEIERMPLADMLAHYYEHTYDELSEAEGEEAAERWREEIAMLVETEQERAEREAREAADRKGTDDFAKDTEALNQKEVRIKEKSRSRSEPPNLEAQAERLRELAKKTGAKIGVSRKYS